MASSRPNDNPPRRDGNLSHLPYSSGGGGNVDTPSGGGYGDGMEARVAKLEAHVEHIMRDTGEIKTDLRDLRKKVDSHFLFLISALGAGFIALIGLMAKGFHWF